MAAPAAIAVGAALGAVNGALVVRFRIHSFVVTLGTMLIWRGVVIALTGGFPMTVAIPPAFKDVMSGPLLDGFRMSMVWFFAIGALGTFLLARTRFGNWVQARGQNEQAARNLGVPVDRVTIILFMLTSALGAVAGVIQVARFSSVDALRGEGMELQAVAVTVIGGTLLSGGYGSVIGTMLGADHLRHDPGRPRPRRRARALLPHAHRLDRRRRRHPQHFASRGGWRGRKPLAGFRRGSAAADAAIAAATARAVEGRATRSGPSGGRTSPEAGR